MMKRLKSLKDMLWAVGLGLCLLALFIGLVAGSFIPYHGDRERPVMDLKAEKEEKAVVAAAKETPAVTGGLKADSTLHPLAQTDDAGEDYLEALTILCDSSFSALRSSGLSFAEIWSSETGSLPMNDTENWKIRYPGDSSLISPTSAALVAKPKLLVLAIGSDEAAGLRKEQFTEKYAALVRGLAKASPEAKIACLSLCSVTAAYAGEDGLTAEKAQEINGWIREVCVDTGAYYGDLAPVLCKDAYLRDEFADGSGRALNTAGLRELLNYLRDHSLNAQ